MNKNTYVQLSRFVVSRWRWRFRQWSYIVGTSRMSRD